jgi:hypothetical protein
MNMTETNTRTFFVLLVSFAALVALVQMSGKTGLQSISTAAFKASSAYKTPAAPAEPMLARKTGSAVALPLNTCAVSWVNGGNSVLAKPSGCNGVSVQAMTIRASAKSCAESGPADFRSLTNSTYFKGDFGFFLGQGNIAGCLVVEQMVGRYL